MDVVQKDIKNLHLSVYPPNGTVKIAAPLRMNEDTIRIYAISKLSWIKKQQEKIRKQEREALRDYITRESHYYLGKRYLLKVIEADASPTVILKHSYIEVNVRPGTYKEKKQEILDNWYREKLKEIIPGIIAKWEKILKVTVSEYGVRKMKTKWGTCNIEKKRIWLNLELAKKPKEYIEYIVVHEMIHLLERNHNERFLAYMNLFLPQWKHLKAQLNRLPVSHREWRY